MKLFQQEEYFYADSKQKLEKEIINKIKNAIRAGDARNSLWMLHIWIH